MPGTQGQVNGRKLCVGEASTLNTYPPARWEGGVAIGSIAEAVAWGRSVRCSGARLRVLLGAEHEAAERVAMSQQNYSLDQLSQRPALLAGLQQSLWRQPKISSTTLWQNFQEQNQAFSFCPQ